MPDSRLREAMRCDEPLLGTTWRLWGRQACKRSMGGVGQCRKMMAHCFCLMATCWVRCARNSRVRRIVAVVHARWGVKRHRRRAVCSYWNRGGIELWSWRRSGARSTFIGVWRKEKDFARSILNNLGVSRGVYGTLLAIFAGLVILTEGGVAKHLWRRWRRRRQWRRGRKGRLAGVDAGSPLAGGDEV